MPSAALTGSIKELVPSFDDFVATRSSEEDVDSWKAFVVQATPTISNSLIASNVEHLLDEAVSTSRLDLIACREVTIQMQDAVIVGGGDCMPGVGRLDEEAPQSGVSSTATCHLAVEVVRSSDRRPV